MKIQNAEIEFVAFDAQDVIATSNTSYDKAVIFSGFGDKDLSNNLMILGGDVYDNDGMCSSGTMMAYMNEYLETSLSNGAKFGDFYISSFDGILHDAEKDSADFDPAVPELNGTWAWINEQFVKQ